MEGVKAHQEACLLHCPLKWVDEDDSANLIEHNQNYSLIADEINNHLLSEDALNGNFDPKSSLSAMVNEIADIPELAESSNSTSDKQENYRSECKYFTVATILRGYWCS